MQTSVSMDTAAARSDAGGNRKAQQYAAAAGRLRSLCVACGTRRRFHRCTARSPRSTTACAGEDPGSCGRGADAWACRCVTGVVSMSPEQACYPLPSTSPGATVYTGTKWDAIERIGRIRICIFSPLFCRDLQRNMRMLPDSAALFRHFSILDRHRCGQQKKDHSERVAQIRRWHDAPGRRHPAHRRRGRGRRSVTAATPAVAAASAAGPGSGPPHPGPRCRAGLLPPRRACPGPRAF